MAILSVWFPVLFAAIGGVLAGYHSSYMSGIVEMKTFKNHFPSIFPEATSNSSNRSCVSGSGNNEEAILVGFLVAIGNLGCIFGSVFAGKLADMFSRRLMLASSGVMLMVGAGLFSMAFYNHAWMVFVGRSISGTAVGLFYVVMPIYIGEMAPKQRRGLMMSMMGPGFAVGTIMALLSNPGFASFEQGWRVSCGVIALVGLVYAVGFIWLPFTPRWLILKNRDKEAFTNLSVINSSSKNVNLLETYFDFEDLKEAKSKVRKNMLYQFLKWRYIRRFVILSCLFVFSSTLISLVSYYPVTFFCVAGLSRPLIVSMILAPINLTASIVSAVVIDKIGRKISLIIAGVVNGTIAMVMGVLLQTWGSGSIAINYVVVVLTCIYSFFFFFAWIIVPWIIVGEAFPLNVKGVAASNAYSLYWMFLFISNFITPKLFGPPLHIHGYLYLMSLFNLLGLLLVVIAIPETKGVSLERIDEVFSQSWLKRIGCGLSKCKSKEPSAAALATSNSLSDIKFSEEDRH